MYDERKVAKTFIVYVMNKNFNVSSYPALENCLFGAVILTKSVDINKCKYSGFGIGFNRHRFLLYSRDGTGKNVINIGVDMSLSTKIDNRKKDILILGKGPTQGLEHTLSAEKNVFN